MKKDRFGSANFRLKAGLRTFRFWLRLIALIGVIAPRRLRANWRHEWEVKLRYRERPLAEWDRLDWRNKLELLRRSASAFWDALWLQPQRWEDEVFQDLRFGVRMLLKHPGFTAVAVLTLALGIGANMASSGAANAGLARPLLFPAPDRFVEGAEIAFVNVSVVPMDREHIQKGQTVIVRDGRIAEIGPATMTSVLKGIFRIDGQGKYLMPGLVDMHIHAYPDESDLFLFIANGVTTVRSMDGQPAHLRLRERIVNGAVLGPRFYTCGPLVNGLKDPERARQIVDEQSRAGYDCIKIYNTASWSKDAYDAIIEAAKSHNVPAVGHIPLNLPIAEALRPGLITAEHAEQFLYYEANKYKNDRRLAEAQIPYLAKLMKEAGISLTPTLMVYKTIPLMLGETTSQELLKRAELKYINKPAQEKWIATQNNDYRKRFGPDRAPYFLDNLAFLKRLTKSLRDGGVRILLGSDATEDQPFVFPGFSIHEELSELVSAGFTPFESLQAGTSNAAQVLNAGNDFGTIAVGKRADLLLLEGNPLEDVRNVARSAGVMVRGQWFPKAELQKKLDELARSYSKN